MKDIMDTVMCKNSHKISSVMYVVWLCTHCSYVWLNTIQTINLYFGRKVIQVFREENKKKYY